MNIAVLTNLYTPLARGGAEHVAEVAAQALVAAGCDVHVVTLAPPGVQVVEHAVRGGSMVHRLPCPNRYHPLDADTHGVAARLRWHLRDLHTAETVRSVGNVLDNAAIDAVISHNLKGLGMRCLEAVRARGLPHVHVLHDLQLSVASGVLWFGRERRGDAQPWFRRWHERQMRRIVGSPTAVVSPSSYLLEVHRTRGFFAGSKTLVLRNPVGAAPPDVPPAAQTLSGPVRFAFVGQLAEHKGVRLLLRAWAKRHTTDCQLHIAGAGALTDEVEAAAACDRSVVAHGKLEPAALHHLLHATDALVVPSIWYENAPLVIVEALAAGCAVVASQIGGIPEMIDADCGVLVAPGDAAALGAALGAFARDLPHWRARRAAIAARRHGPSPGEYARALLDLVTARYHPASEPS